MALGRGNVMPNAYEEGVDAERDRTIEQMVGANEAHQKLLEEERRAANQARKMSGIRRERIKTLEARLRFAETRAEHWERRADRLGRLALEAMVPEARVGDPLFEAAARGGESSRWAPTTRMIWSRWARFRRS